MNTKSLNILLALSVGVAALAVLPAASAQVSSGQTTVAIVMAPPSDAVKPLQAPLVFSGSYTVTTSQDSQYNVVGIPIALTVSSFPPWATVTVNPASDVLVPTQPGPSASFQGTKQFTVTVTATDAAPAFQPGNVEITITATPKQPQAQAATSKAAVPVTAAYFGLLDAQLAESVKIERPQQAVVFPLKLTNLGNANTKVTFDLGDKAENLNVPVPNPVVLQSKQAGGNQITSTVPLTVQTPYHNGYLNEVGVVNFKLTSAYAFDPKLKGDELRVAVVVTTKGFYVPGVEIPAVLAMLGIVAIAVRRRAA